MLACEQHIFGWQAQRLALAAGPGLLPAGLVAHNPEVYNQVGGALAFGWAAAKKDLKEVKP